MGLIWPVDWAAGTFRDGRFSAAIDRRKDALTGRWKFAKSRPTRNRADVEFVDEPFGRIRIRRVRYASVADAIERFDQRSGTGKRVHLARLRVCGMEALRMLSGPVVFDGVRLSDVFLAAEHRGTHGLRVSGCCADSRRCRPGDLFVAIRGSRVDGHEYIADAVHRGATAVICEHLPADVNVPSCVVADTRAAFGLLCQALAGNPSDDLSVIGLTGTNGKTTTSYLIAGVLDAAGVGAGVLGTLGYFDGLAIEPAPLTTPTAPGIAQWLARMSANGCTHAAMEVSSHALALGRVAGITFDVACFTNLRSDHLDFHGDIEKYHAAKAKLLNQLAPDGVAILNVDDPGSVKILSQTEGPVVSVGIDTPAEIQATPLEQHSSEQTWLLDVRSETIPVRTTLIGRHNIYNCLQAVAVGVHYGIDLPTIVRGVESVARVPGRLERIDCGQPFGVYVDYAHTADALSECLKALRDVTHGRLICVFGAGGDRDATKRPEMGRTVARQADVAVVTSDNPRTEDPQAIVDGILKGFPHRSQALVIRDRGEAIQWALSEARQGDSVLIAGKGHEDYQIIGQERIDFDDREVAREWLFDGEITESPYRE